MDELITDHPLSPFILYFMTGVLPDKEEKWLPVQ